MGKALQPIIHSTTNYSMFTRISSNREVNKPHLKKLVESIRARNMLHLYPLIVNKKKEIIDGQHRLGAARELKLPVYYIVDDEVSKADIARMNNNRKGWSARDYIVFFAKEGNSAYKNLNKLLTDFPKLTVGTGLKLIDQTANAYFISGGHMTQKMRLGQIDASKYLVGYKVAELCAELSKEFDYAFQGSFILGIKNVVMSSPLKVDECLERIKSRKELLPAQIEYAETCLPILKGMVQQAPRQVPETTSPSAPRVPLTPPIKQEKAKVVQEEEPAENVEMFDPRKDKAFF